MSIFQKLSGGVVAPKGFVACGVEAGIKTKNKKDLALILSKVDAVGAGVYTTNKVKASPLILTKERIEKNLVKALVVNSGNANVCNGNQGMDDAKAMTKAVAKGLNLEEEKVLVSSTGVIGQPMPMYRVLGGIEEAVQVIPSFESEKEYNFQNIKLQGGNDAAYAIMTTDTVPKQVALSFPCGKAIITIGAMAKGSGMIHPNMATMLCFVTTDALIEKDFLQSCLKEAVEESFNMISVDGDTSTNDMVLVLANGLAENDIIKAGTSEAKLFLDALKEVCLELAKSVAADGEGATKLIEVEVIGARTLNDAKLIAKSVISSSLLKAAIFGKDANWGRILCAAGYSGGDFDPEIIDIYLGEEQVSSKGKALAFNEENALRILSQNTVKITLNLHQGEFKATAFGCDLTYEYVRINGEYRT